MSSSNDRKPVVVSAVALLLGLSMMIEAFAGEAGSVAAARLMAEGQVWAAERRLVALEEPQGWVAGARAEALTVLAVVRMETERARAVKGRAPLTSGITQAVGRPLLRRG